MSNNDNFDNLDNLDNKRSKRTKKVDGDSGHKKPWREEYATPAEIKAFLSDHVYLRYNTVKYRVEARLPSEDPFCQNSELAQFVSDAWQPMSDRLRNTLLTALQAVKPTRRCDLDTVIDSGYVPGYHPFLFYLNSLPPWDGQDHILGLSVSVMVKGGTEKQMLFYEYLKRWLVAILAYDARPESEAKLQTVRRVTGVTPDCMDFSRVPRTHTVRARNLVFILSPLSPSFVL